MRLTQRSDLKGVLHLLGHGGSLCVCTALILFEVPFWQGLVPVQGILLIFLFTLLHETSHKTPFQSDWLNWGVGHLCGVLLFLPATWFRYFHLAHHRFTHVPGKDPELDAPKPATLLQYIRHVSGGPIWISQAKTLWHNAMGRNAAAYIPDARRAWLQAEALCYLGIYAVALGLSLWWANANLVFVWLLPLLLGQPVLRLYLLAEHARCPHVSNMFENTRTTFTTRLVRLIAWNMPYHAEHHSYPAVPFHKLPELHSLMAPHLRQTAKGYVAFNQQYVRDGLD